MKIPLPTRASRAKEASRKAPKPRLPDRLKWLPWKTEGQKRKEVGKPVALHDAHPEYALWQLVPLQEKARHFSLCSAMVTVRRPRGETLKHARICAADVAYGGLCWTHYLRDALRVPTGRPGKGKTMRPFTSRDIPWSHMTGEQIAALRELPVSTPLNACLAVMSAAVATNQTSL